MLVVEPKERISFSEFCQHNWINKPTLTNVQQSYETPGNDTIFENQEEQEDFLKYEIFEQTYNEIVTLITQNL